jgi:RNA polymerase sigma-70 factor (ECF subfamily)
MVEDDRAVHDRLEDVLRAESAKMIRALFAFSRSRQIAEDAVLEAFARAVRDVDRIDDPTAWVWRVAYRVAANELREARRPLDLEPEPVYEMPPPALEVFEAIGMLSPSQRACVLLFHYADRPIREIASTIGSTTPAVKVHLSAGRRRLRRLLEDPDEANP